MSTNYSTFDADYVKTHVDCRRLAEFLGVTITKSGRRYSTARCIQPSNHQHGDRNPSMLIFADGFDCRACGVRGDAFDLWRQLRGGSFPDAVATVADWAGLRSRETPRAGSSRQPQELKHESTSDTNVGENDDKQFEEARGRARQLYRAFWETGRGCFKAAGFLNRRCIDNVLAEQVGICAVDGVRLQSVFDRYPRERLAEAGFVRADGNLFPSTRNTYVVFSYWKDKVGGEIDTLRIRATGKGQKPLSVCGTGVSPSVTMPTIPYLGWIAIANARRQQKPLFVVEGELDALSIVSTGYPAVGTISCATWQAGWCRGWADLSDVVVLADGDAAGERLYPAVRKVARSVLGDRWVSERLHDWTFRAGENLDANEALQQGELPGALKHIERNL